MSSKANKVSRIPLSKWLFKLATDPRYARKKKYRARQVSWTRPPNHAEIQKLVAALKAGASARDNTLSFTSIKTLLARRVYVED